MIIKNKYFLEISINIEVKEGEMQLTMKESF